VKLSPSQEAYWNIKRRYNDTILFFKIGSFYECYAQDAEIGARELGWKMTLSGVGHCHQARRRKQLLQCCSACA
jgi:DNA mismatch repair protein MSH6